MGMQTRQLGSQGPLVSAISLGCMGMSGMYGATDEEESIRTIHEAVDRGVTLLDTGDFYGMGHNELLIRRALESLRSKRESVLLSVKFGAMRDPRGGWTGYDARPAAVKNFLAYSLQRLGVDHIDIYRPARLDPQVPIEDTIGAIGELVKQGYVRYIGLSEVSAATMRKAHAVHPISDLQIEYALVTRGIERDILPAAQELGIGITAYGVLSRGLLSGSTPQGRGDFRAFLPRFRGANLEQNRVFVEGLRAMAEKKGATPAALAIAWVLAKSKSIVPVVGARKVQQLDEALAAAELQLTHDEIASLELLAESAPISGSRYDEGQMKALDSEKTA